jgi:hypothetical protein
MSHPPAWLTPFGWGVMAGALLNMAVTLTAVYL